MKKYRDALIEQTLNQLEPWLDSPSSVDADEIYRLLHSLKGTAGTLEMDELAVTADRLMERMEENRNQQAEWSSAEVRSFLIDLLEKLYAVKGVGGLPFDAAGDNPRLDADKPLMLILDDDVALLMYLKEQIEAQGWVVVATKSAEKAISYYHNLSPDCFMVDYFLPGTDGLQVMGAISDIIRKRMSSTIMISSDGSRETRLGAFRLGADDFLQKPLDLEELYLRLERKLERKAWVDQALFVDELTGAYNRKYLADQFERLRQDYDRTGKCFSIAVMDLDHFKTVNDTYGHLMGDFVLTEFTRFMKSNLRPSDSFCRYGGEEFVLLLPHTGCGEAVCVLDRLREGFAGITFNGAGSPFCVTMSTGVVEYGGDRTQLKYWLETADLALYQAKAGGRNRVVAAGPSMPPVVKPQLKVAIIDDDAIVRGMLGDSFRRLFRNVLHAEVRTFAGGNAFFSDGWHGSGGSYLVVLDGMMPGMDGMEVLSRIRSREDADSYLVIMLTGRDGTADTERALELGADDYVTKPYSLHDLEERILRLVKQLG